MFASITAPVYYALVRTCGTVWGWYLTAGRAIHRDPTWFAFGACGTVMVIVAVWVITMIRRPAGTR